MMSITKIEINGVEHHLREIKKLAGESVKAAAESWHETEMPQHFKQGAATKYAYQPRKVKYLIRKARKFHHQRPLVYTGRSERAARSMVKVSSRNVAGETTVRGIAAMPMLSKYFFQRRTTATPDKAAELTTATSAEVQRLGEVYRADLLARLERTKSTTTTRVG